MAAAAYRRVDDLQSPAGCLYTGISSGPNARQRVWKALPFTYGGSWWNTGLDISHLHEWGRTITEGRLTADSRGYKKPCISWGSRSDELIRSREWRQDSVVAFCQITSDINLSHHRLSSKVCEPRAQLLFKSWGTETPRSETPKPSIG